MPGTYDTGAADSEFFGHHTWPYGTGGHDTALPWETPGYRTDPNDQWYEDSWAGPTGQTVSPADPDSSDALAAHYAATPVDLPSSPDEASPYQSAPEPAADRSTPPGGQTSRRADGRRRRAPRRGSAFLSVVAPSLAFMGMAGVAAASIGLGGSGRAVQAASAPPVDPSAANAEFDVRLSTLSREADDFADRTSRTQERVDLARKQREEQRRKAAEAARREALRPKFVLPVAQKGVGELFGAAGSMWSNRHTGLDFPVPMNTPVMAVTDGTVVAKWNPAYGNIVEVTAPDGTQTWYAHLASARIRSGHVEAGTVIAYAGSSGNSSGPHLHLEVRPGGGDPVDPLPWLRGHGLDPA